MIISIKTHQKDIYLIYIDYLCPHNFNVIIKTMN